ncbi:MAG: CHAP domain-containing protein [Clostridiales bacterium]|nr:CHAP domain-containing protein [Clostridiales bacterium]
MTLQEFFDSLEGQHIDVDNAGSSTNKYQCVDLIKSYCNKLFGVSVSAMSGYGNAYEYYTKFEKKSALYNNFTKIAYTSSMEFKAGDIVVWKADFSSTGAGHVAIATGTYSQSKVQTFDQNYPSGSACKYVTHTHNKINGVLRPKDSSKLGADSSSATAASSESFVSPKTWKNGSTKETVYKLSSLSSSIGTLSAKESAKCYEKKGSGYLVVYDLDSTSKHKAGFVSYKGGISGAPTGGKTYKNGSTAENVYADTAKKTKVGSLNKNESCTCLAVIDGMYLVVYKVDSASYYKCGFVSYSGGLG